MFSVISSVKRGSLITCLVIFAQAISYNVVPLVQNVCKSYLVDYLARRVISNTAQLESPGVERVVLNIIFVIYCHYLIPKFKPRAAKDERYVLYFGGIDSATLTL